MPKQPRIPTTLSLADQSLLTRFAAQLPSNSPLRAKCELYAILPPLSLIPVRDYVATVEHARKQLVN